MHNLYIKAREKSSEESHFRPTDETGHREVPLEPTVKKEHGGDCRGKEAA